MLSLTAFRSTLSTSKLWISPDNKVVPLMGCWHYEYFRDPQIAEKYGVPFGAEIPTRLAALRVGFVRVNYERNGGLLTIESMRFDPLLAVLMDDLVLANADAIDRVRLHLVDGAGMAIGMGTVSLQALRADGKSVSRQTLGSWHDFPTTVTPALVRRKRSDVS
jgi:hypothetical protein